MASATPLKLANNYVPTQFQAGDFVATANGGTGQTTASTGDLLLGSGGSWTRLGIGSSTNVLTVSGGTAVWAAPANVNFLILASQTNANGGSVVIGAPVYATGTANHIDKAEANAFSTAQCIGLVFDTSIASAAAGNVITVGQLTATTGQWDAVAGTTGGLTSGTIYYLSDSSAGTLTSTAPNTAGHFVIPVVEGISTTIGRLISPFQPFGL